MDAVGSRTRTVFRTGDMLVVSAAWLLILVPLAAFLLYPDGSSRVEPVAKYAVGIPTLLVPIIAISRGLFVRVELLTDGVYVHNFWRNRFVPWSDFERFVPPADRGSTTSFSASLVRKDGHRVSMTAIQARNFNAVLNREDRASRELVERMNLAANAMRAG